MRLRPKPDQSTASTRVLKTGFALLASVFLLLAPPADADVARAEAELRIIREALPFISTRNFAYRREPSEISGSIRVFITGNLIHTPPPEPESPEGKIKAAWEALNGLHSPSLTLPALTALTSHRDPDLRALALLGLLARETQDVVIASLRLRHDHAATLPEHSTIVGGHPGDRQIFTQPQTVANIADLILASVEFRFGSGQDPFDLTPERWWERRKDNPDWLAWYRFLYLRATRGSSPVHPDAKPSVRRFRQVIDALPDPTRAWALLYLADDVFHATGYWQDHYATEQEMIAAVRRLGPATLLEYLRSGKRTGLRDPFLDGAGHGIRFLETYAGHFFDSRHADALMDLKLFGSSLFSVGSG